MDRTSKVVPHLSSTDRTGVLEVGVPRPGDDRGVGDDLRSLRGGLLLVADATVEVLVRANIDDERVNVPAALSTSETLLVIDLQGGRLTVVRYFKTSPSPHLVFDGEFLGLKDSSVTPWTALERER